MSRSNGSNRTLPLRNTTPSSLSYSIVWTPIPIITWMVPFIGHTGIADSKGIVSDFQGPYTVGDAGHMAFGAPARALHFHHVEELAWDTAIQEANQVYRGRMHHLCCDNCHSHVAYALNHMQITEFGIERWNMVNIAVLLLFRGRFLSWKALLISWGPFGVLVTLILFLKLVRGGK